MGGGRTGILRRLSIDEPSLAVLTSPSQKQTDRYHPLEPRSFTVRENARIQSFPDDCACFLVEAIAKHSQNIAWAVSVDGRTQRHRRIRRVSLDKFYSLVTGQTDAFYKICMVLPEVVEEVVRCSTFKSVPQDTVFDELQVITGGNNKANFDLALYLLGFSSYSGFCNE